MPGSSTPIQTERSSLWLTLAFILVVPTVAHCLYSALGFNPSDDGFILAGSRRILDGQIPHRDFISIRPVGSYILHAPFVWLGGCYTLWISRWFVWIELAATAWLATVAIRQLLRVKMPAVVLVALGLLAVCLGVNSVPIMAWHSFDALFLSVLGFYITVCSSNRSRLIGYLLLGAAPLCRQNFLLAPLATLMLMGHWREWRCWLAAAAPGVAMVFVLLLTSAWGDAWVQLTAQSGLYAAGIEPYLTSGIFRDGMIMGVVAALLFVLADRYSQHSGGWIVPGVISTMLLFLPPAVALSYLYKGNFLGTPSMRIFGMALGSTLLLSVWPHNQRPRFQSLLFFLLLAWSVSVSIGYRTTAPAAGFLAVILILTGLTFMRRLEFGRWSDRLYYALTLLLLIPALACFDHARRNHIYRERPAAELTYPLGDVLAGGRLIYTNEATYDLMADLDLAVDRVGTGMFSIVPDFACYWVTSAQPNPLPLDWIQSTELPTAALRARLIDALELKRGSMTVLVQKVSARFIASGINPLRRTERYEVANHIVDNWTSVGETEYFRLYK